MDRLLRPRRIAIALGIAILVGGIPSVFAGMETEENPTYLPATFQVKSPGDGDMGQYNHTIFAHSGEQWTPFNDSAPGFGFINRFHWLPLDGLQLVREVGELRSWGCNLNGKQITGHQSDLFLPDGTFVGTGSGCDFSNDPIVTEEEGWGRRILSTDSSRLDIDDEARRNTAACALRHGFQQASLDPRNLSGLFEDCWMQADSRLPAPEVRAAGMADTTVGEALVVEVKVGGGSYEQSTAQYWFVESNPYPIRITIDFHGEGPAWFDPYGERPEGRALHVYELETYRGGVGAPTPPTYSTGWKQAPYGMTGVTDDVDHVFPLADAIEVARTHADHPDLRDYLADHPAAVVQYATFSTNVAEGREDHRWNIVISDGDGAYMDSIVRRDQRHTPSNIEHFTGLQGPYRDPEYLFPGFGFGTTGFPGPPGTIGVQASSLYDRYEAFTGRTANTYGVMPCGNRCDGGTLMVVGEGEELTTGQWEADDVFFASGQESMERTDWLFFDAHGRFVGLEHKVMTDRYGENIQPTQARAKFEVAPATAKTESSLVWQPSAGLVASSGAAGILVAALYWFWPVLKSGPLVLFSRIREDKLLDHPTRRSVMLAIESNPGVHLQDLARTTSQGVGTVRHHTDKLEAGGLIRRVRHGGYMCHFVASTPRAELASAGATRSSGARKVLTAVQEGHVSPTAVSSATGLAVGTVHYHLKRLQTAGLLRGDAGAYVAA